MKTVNIPWGAWYQDTELALPFPEDFHVDVLAPASAPQIDEQEISARIADPIGGPRLPDLARGCKTACLVVDDLARPTKSAAVVSVVAGELERSGIAAEAIDIVVATGSHGPLSSDEVCWKVGERNASRYRVESHDCRSNLAGTGHPYGDRELHLNRTFVNADFKMAIGSVLPHSFAGFSGGAKLILPGLADLASISRSHKFVQLGLRGGSNPNQNQFRIEAEEIARSVGLSFVVCVLSNSSRQISGVYAGDLVEAHRAACEAARTSYATPVSKTYDCAVLNAFPKDFDLIQAANVFVAWKTARKPVVKEDGLVILLTAASNGIGEHGLFDPEGVSYRAPEALRHLRGRELWIVTPTLTRDLVHRLYWDGYRVIEHLDEFAPALSARLPSGSTVGVFPQAPMQQVDDLR